jgi:PilZ domain
MIDKKAENSRIALRSRMLKSARLISMGNRSLVDCTIKDMSATGAKLSCSDPMAVPTQFRFLVPSENTICDARIVWRRGNLLGVEFIGEKTAAPSRKFAAFN